MPALLLITGMSGGGMTLTNRALNQISGVVAFCKTLFSGHFFEPPAPEGLCHESHLEPLAGRHHRFSIGPNGGVGGLNFSQE